ncbi:hypothetical protein HY008_02800 [Candidatus Woesebacteria bacterium]|nr:hypothetical protein [Candidatus Woesebacteria bacterium]
MSNKYLPYFWDYQLTSNQLKNIINNREGDSTKRWAIARLLESAPFAEIWKYITLKQLKSVFPKLKLKKSIARAWQRALTVWSK